MVLTGSFLTTILNRLNQQNPIFKEQKWRMHGEKKQVWKARKKSLLQICLPFPPGHLESCHNCHLHWCHLKGKGKKKLDLSLMLGSKGKGYFSVTDQFSFKHWFCYALTSVVKCVLLPDHRL